MNRPLGYAIRLFECLESLSSTLTTQPVYSAQYFLFPTFDKLDLNWLSDQSCLLEYDVMPAQSNHYAIVIMVLRYPAYSSPYRHWLSTGVCTPGGKSARAVDEWKDNSRVGFTPYHCWAAMRYTSSPCFHYIVSPYFFSARHLKHPEGVTLHYYGTPRSSAKSDIGLYATYIANLKS